MEKFFVKIGACFFALFLNFEYNLVCSVLNFNFSNLKMSEENKKQNPQNTNPKPENSENIGNNNSGNGDVFNDDFDFSFQSISDEKSDKNPPKLQKAEMKMDETKNIEKAPQATTPIPKPQEKSEVKKVDMNSVNTWKTWAEIAKPVTNWVVPTTTNTDNTENKLDNVNTSKTENPVNINQVKTETVTKNEEIVKSENKIENKPEVISEIKNEVKSEVKSEMNIEKAKEPKTADNMFASVSADKKDENSNATSNPNAVKNENTANGTMFWVNGNSNNNVNSSMNMNNKVVSPNNNQEKDITQKKWNNMDLDAMIAMFESNEKKSSTTPQPSAPKPAVNSANQTQKQVTNQNANTAQTINPNMNKAVAQNNAPKPAPKPVVNNASNPSNIAKQAPKTNMDAGMDLSAFDLWGNTNNKVQTNVKTNIPQNGKSVNVNDEAKKNKTKKWILSTIALVVLLAIAWVIVWFMYPEEIKGIFWGWNDNVVENINWEENIEVNNGSDVNSGWTIDIADFGSWETDSLSGDVENLTWSNDLLTGNVKILARLEDLETTWTDSHKELLKRFFAITDPDFDSNMKISADTIYKFLLESAEKKWEDLNIEEKDREIFENEQALNMLLPMMETLKEDENNSNNNKEESYDLLDTSYITYNDDLVDIIDKEITAYENFVNSEMSDEDYKNYQAILIDLIAELETLGCFKEDCSIYDPAKIYLNYAIDAVRNINVVTNRSEFENKFTELFDILIAAQSSFNEEYVNWENISDTVNNEDNVDIENNGNSENTSWTNEDGINPFQDLENVINTNDAYKKDAIDELQSYIDQADYFYNLWMENNHDDMIKYANYIKSKAESFIEEIDADDVLNTEKFEKYMEQFGRYMIKLQEYETQVNQVVISIDDMTHNSADDFAYEDNSEGVDTYSIDDFQKDETTEDDEAIFNYEEILNNSEDVVVEYENNYLSEEDEINGYMVMEEEQESLDTTRKANMNLLQATLAASKFDNWAYPIYCGSITNAENGFIQELKNVGLEEDIADPVDTTNMNIIFVQSNSEVPLAWDGENMTWRYGYCSISHQWNQNAGYIMLAKVDEENTANVAISSSAVIGGELDLENIQNNLCESFVENPDAMYSENGFAEAVDWVCEYKSGDLYYAITVSG